MSEKQKETLVMNPIWDVMSPDTIDLSTIEKEFTEYREINVSNTSTLTKLEIETKDRDAFLLPNEGYLELRYKVTQTNGTALAAPENTTIQNNVLSLFKNIEYLIEDQRIEYCDDPGMGHTVKNMSEFSKDHAESIASNQHFFLDTTDEAIGLNKGNKVRFYNNTSPRVGVELFFKQNAAFKLIPTVAADPAIWAANDAVIMRVGDYYGPEVRFITRAGVGAAVLRNITLTTADGIVTLAGSANGDLVSMVVGRNTFGTNVTLYQNATPISGVAVDAAFQPVITPNLQDAVFTPYASTYNYNEGFESRVKITGSGALACAWIPLKSCFLFLKSFDKVSRGLRHRFIFNKQADSQMIFRDTDAADRHIDITYISAWIPRLKPNLDTLNILQKQLASNETFDVNFTDLTVFRSGQIYVGNASNTALQLATTTKKPVKVFVVFQKNERVIDSQTINKRVFDFLGTSAIQCRLNGKIFPMFEYSFDSVNPNVGINRVYNAWLNSGYKMNGFDGSSCIDLEKWLRLYPIFYFNLEHQDEDLFKSQKYAELEIRWSNAANTFAPTGYHIWCIYESERLVKFKCISGSLALVL